MFYASTLLMTTLTFLVRPMISYRALEVGLPTSWLGLFVVSYALLPLVVAMPAGRAADRHGEASVTILGAVVMLVAVIGLAIAGGAVVLLLAANALLGAGQLLMVVGQQAFIPGAVDRRRLDAVFGYYMFVVSAGQSVGPLVGVALGGSGALPDTAAGFTGAAVLAAVVLAVSLPIGSTGHAAATAGSASTGRAGAVMRTPGMVGMMAASVVTTATTELILVYLPALGTELGLSAGVVGLLLSVRAIAAMASRFLTGPLVARFGRRRILVTSILVAAAGLAAVPVPLPVAATAAVVAVAGAGLAMGPPLTMAWISDVMAPGLRGVAISVRVVGNRAGQVAIPLAAGLVAAQAGAAGVFWMLATGLGGCLLPVGRLRDGVDRPGTRS